MNLTNLLWHGMNLLVYRASWFFIFTILHSNQKCRRIPLSSLPNHYSIFQFGKLNMYVWICTQWNSIAFIHSPQSFFEHLFICLSDSCDFSFCILCSYLYRGTYFFFILFESVTCFRQRRWSCVPIFHLPVNFIQDIFCGTIIQNADVFLSPLGLCFRSFV